MAAKKSIPQVINLLRTGNDYLPSVQHGHEQLQKQNNYLESILRNKAGEDQNLNDQIKNMQSFQYLAFTLAVISPISSPVFLASSSAA
jgi:hypothetical protein